MVLIVRIHVGRPSLFRPETDVTILRARFFTGVARVGHHPHRDDVPGFLTESAPVVLEHVAPQFAPFADMAAPLSTTMVWIFAVRSFATMVPTGASPDEVYMMMA